MACKSVGNWWEGTTFVWEYLNFKQTLFVLYFIAIISRAKTLLYNNTLMKLFISL